MRKTTSIGLINIMPNALEYERLIRNALHSQMDHVEIHPIKLETHRSHSSQFASDRYSPFFELVKQVDLDLLILTGAPVEHLPFGEISYWPELSRIFAFAEANISSVLGICFGGLAAAKYLNINKRVLPAKQFGLLHFDLAPGHERYFGPEARRFLMPFSSWATLDASDMAARGADIEVLATNETAGCGVLQSRDRKFLMVLGHPEYTVETLREEWMRDIPKAIGYTENFSEQSFLQMGALMARQPRNLIADWVLSHAFHPQLA